LRVRSTTTAASRGPRSTGALVSVVIPTLGRGSLHRLLRSLIISCDVPLPRIIVVDDRPDATDVLELTDDERGAGIEVLESGGRGPCAARNRGWRATDSEWVAFLDDDVVVAPTWYDELLTDLRTSAPEVGGVQGGIHAPSIRVNPTDDGHEATRVESAPWFAADMAYRRIALVCAGGFEERFPRAGREDMELALRVRRLGWRLVVGWRDTTHGGVQGDAARP
jgi:glycosyltransferase involved in cell wall biosynthesis